MSILKYKYKAHKLINILFYVAVFGIGFILGFGTNKIDFNKLVTQVLMIDSAKAYTMYTYNGIKVDEDFIYERFVENNNNSANTDFDISVYPYIYCNVYNTSSSDRTDPNLVCNAFKEDKLNPTNILFYKSGSSYYAVYSGMVSDNGINENPDVVGFSYKLVSKKYPSQYPQSMMISSSANYYTNFDKSNVGYGSYTQIPDSRFHNVLDFTKLEFNENLFKDNPDFKEVCVDKTDKFLITPVDYGENNEIFTTDFIWFPYKISGFYGSAIDNDNLIGENVSDEYRYYFNSKEAINEEFNEDGLQYLLTIVSYYSYENRYSYYGWSAHPFDLYYNQNNDNVYRFPYFYFENPEMYKLDGSKIENEESLPFDDYLSYDNEEICFYIRNKFNVEILNKDLNDNDYIDLTLPGGSVHINKDTSNFSSGLFTSITKFINEVSDCLDLIKDNIYNFYLSMPYLLRLFIVSTFTVLIVKFIIGMVVK